MALAPPPTHTPTPPTPPPAPPPPLSAAAIPGGDGAAGDSHDSKQCPHHGKVGDLAAVSTGGSASDGSEHASKNARTRDGSVHAADEEDSEDVSVILKQDLGSEVMAPVQHGPRNVDAATTLASRDNGAVLDVQASKRLLPQTPARHDDATLSAPLDTYGRGDSGFVLSNAAASVTLSPVAGRRARSHSNMSLRVYDGGPGAGGGAGAGAAVRGTPKHTAAPRSKSQSGTRRSFSESRAAHARPTHPKRPDSKLAQRLRKTRHDGTCG